MSRPEDTRRRRRNRILIAVALLALLALSIDDWGRDLSEHEAVTTVDAADPGLRPFESRRTVGELVEALRFAGARIGNWDYVGTVADDSRTIVNFVATHRLLRVKQDITVLVEDLGNRRVVTAASTSRLALPDLGRNPANLRRILVELRAVLDGSVPSSVAAVNLERR